MEVQTGVVLQFLALAWLGGAAATALGQGLIAAPVGLLLGLFSASFSASKVGRARRLAAGVVLAAVAYGSAQVYLAAAPSANRSDVSHFIGAGPTRVRGVVDADRDERQRALYLRIRVQEVETDTGRHDASGTLLVRGSLALAYDYGDRVELSGKLTAPAQTTGFDYRAYLARQGIYAEMLYPTSRLLRHHQGNRWQEALVRLRERLAAGITHVLPEPEASLGAGIALGTRRVIEPELNAALTSTGTAQIVVASGYNITLVSIFVLSGFSWLIGRRGAALLSLPAIAAYALFVGLYPSVVRAAIMGLVIVLASLVGRPHSGLRALTIASAIMVMQDPRVLQDLSFLLSLSGTAGLFLFAAPFGSGVRLLISGGRPGAEPSSAARAAGESIATTLAAMLASLPLILATFHTLSLASLPANLILFPIVPAIMAGSAAASVAGALWHPAALVFAPLAYALLAVMVGVVRLTASMPVATTNVAWFGVPAAAVAYLVLGLAAWQLDHGALLPAAKIGLWTRQSLRRLTPALAIAGPWKRGASASSLDAHPARAGVRSKARLLAGICVCSLVVAVCGVAFLQGSEGDTVQVTFLDIGAGRSVLLESGSSRILVDGGPPGDGTLRALDAHLRPWQRSLNLIVVSEASDGSLGGLPSVLSRYRVEAVLDAGPRLKGTTTGPAARAWQSALAASVIAQLPAASSARISFGSATLSIQSTDTISGAKTTPQATVVLTEGRRQVVLAGDAAGNVPAEARWLPETHNSASATAPEVAILQSGPSSRADADLSGLPFGLHSALVYRSIEHGEIRLRLSKGELQVEVQRGPRLGLFSGRP